jgi:ZIP family zinc transporter
MSPMGEALAWGLLAGSSLVLGGAIGVRFDLSRRALGLIMAFGAGVLISAVAYELVLEAADAALGTGAAGAGLAAGALVFFGGDALITRRAEPDRKSANAETDGGSPLSLVLGIVLDGIPESFVIGLSLVEGGAVSAAVIVAVFLSNLPEGIAATKGLLTRGWPAGRIMGLWGGIMLVSGLSSAAGFVLLDGASSGTLAFVLAFAGGAILTMLASTMMPEAFEKGGKLAGLLTTLGFAVAFFISSLE